jgi:mannose-6-phosphate isomerase-like protein (cupin superfamily)
MRPEAHDFVQAVLRELESAPLERNPRAAAPTQPPDAFESAVALDRQRPGGSLLDPIVWLRPYLAWFTGERYWPGTEYRGFASRIWGAYVVGRDDAAFTAQERYYVLLGVLGAHTSYPLHEHGMEEAYLVVSGRAEWSYDDVEWSTLPPGAVFHVRSREPHSMRTGADSLVFASFYVPPIDWRSSLVVGPQT